MIDNVRILVLGDAGAGKTSIIDTYITHYFSGNLPAVMVDSLIPKDATTNGVNTTIMDSSADQEDREVLLHKIRIADSIIVVYDVSRLETLDNLQTHWLPFIEEVCQAMSERCKPVIIAANKTDLGSQDEERERNKLIELLERFSFVQLCDRCSAKLLDVDKVFYHSESAISFPMEPLYDYRREVFTYPAKLAFIRVFRAIDVDKDGILEDSDVDNLQQICFGSPFAPNDLNELKKQICKSSACGTDLMDKNRFKFLGFLELLRSSVERLQLQNPWIILRKFGYDNNINLVIPPHLREPPDLLPDQASELCADAYDFLINLAFGAIENSLVWSTPDDDVVEFREDELSPDKAIRKSDSPILTAKALHRILCIMPADVQHPWKAPPIWRLGNESYLLSGAITTASENNTLSYAYAVDTWMTHWQMLAMFRPVETQELLYRLGFSKLFQRTTYVDDSDEPCCDDNGLMWRDKESPGRTIKVGIFGASGSGKKSFVRALSGYPGEKGEFIDVSELGSGATTGILYGGACRQVRDFRTAASVGPDTNRESRRQSLLRRPNVFIIAAAVTPEGTRDWLALHGESLDVAVVMFSCDESEAANTTLDVAIGLEKLLPKEVPRVFVANKSDLLPEVPREDAGAQLSTFAKDVGNDSFTTSNHIANDLIARTETYLREHHPRHGSVKLVSAKSLEGFEDVVRTVIDTASRPISNTFSRVGLYNGMLVWGGLLTALSAATFAGIAVYFSDRKLQKYATEVYDEARTICRGVVNVTLSMLPVFGH